MIDLKKKDHSEDDKVEKSQNLKKKHVTSVGHRKVSPGKPNNYSKLNERDKETLYLDVYDENLNLKKKEETLTTQIKQ